MNNSKHLQFGKIQKSPLWEIKKIFYLDNSKNFHFGQFLIFRIRLILKIVNLGNSENVQFVKFQKISNLEYSKNFPNFTISKIIISVNWLIPKNFTFSKFYNLQNSKIHKFFIS